MSYLVLARKYRPQTFDDLVGQEHLSRTLRNALETRRVAHAYLFTGPRGVGKTTAARLLAMALNCQTEPAGQRPCGQCPSCREIAGGQSLEVMEIDGASNRGIDEIRDLRETVKYLPSQGLIKVYIIDEVHMLTKEAFNALLKTLEEPPAHVVFIFATTEAHKVPSTVLSRCQRYDFKRIRTADMIKRLAGIAVKENFVIEPEALALIAREAGGGLRDALSLLDQLVAFSGPEATAQDALEALGLIEQNVSADLVNGPLEGQADQGLAALERAYKQGYEFKDLAAKALEHIRRLALIKAAPQAAGALLDIGAEELAEIEARAARHSLETLNHHFDAWLKVQGELARHPQPRLVLEALVIRLAQIKPLRPLAELVKRLERLLAASGTINRPPGGPEASRPGQLPAPPLELRRPASPLPEPPLPEPPSPEPPLPEPPLPEPPLPESMEAGPAAPAWSDFLKKHQNKLGYLAAYIAEAQPISFGAAKVSLNFANAASYKLANGPGRAALERELAVFLGRPPVVDLTGPQDAAAPQENQAEIMREFLEQPQVRTALAILPIKENHQPNYYPEATPPQRESAGPEEDLEGDEPDYH